MAFSWEFPDQLKDLHIRVFTAKKSFGLGSSGRRKIVTDLVEPVVDGPVELFGRVGGEHEHKLVGLLSGPVEKCVESGAEVLRDLLGAALAEERVGLINKQDQALSGSLCPIKYLDGRTKIKKGLNF